MRLLYFTAPWCLPCEKFGPIVEEFSDVLPITKINTDDDFVLAMQYKITSVPTLIILNNDVEKNRRVGALDRASLAQFLATNIRP
jgi:thioredoxin 1